MAWRATSWKSINVDGAAYTRDLNTMPQWAGSCWYFLRFCDPNNDDFAWSEEAEKYWMPVDLYIGGAEHAVLHLLYSRFWHKVLYDAGHVSTKEPFQKLFNQGKVEEISDILAPDCRIKESALSFVSGKDACLELLRKQAEKHIGEGGLEVRKTRLGEVSVRITDKVAVVYYDAGVTDKEGLHEILVTAIFRFDSGNWLLIHYHDDWKE